MNLMDGMTRVDRYYVRLDGESDGRTYEDLIEWYESEGWCGTSDCTEITERWDEFRGEPLAPEEGKRLADYLGFEGVVIGIEEDVLPTVYFREWYQRRDRFIVLTDDGNKTVWEVEMWRDHESNGNGDHLYDIWRPNADTLEVLLWGRWRIDDFTERYPVGEQDLSAMDEMLADDDTVPYGQIIALKIAVQENDWVESRRLRSLDDPWES